MPVLLVVSNTGKSVITYQTLGNIWFSEKNSNQFQGFRIPLETLSVVFDVAYQTKLFGRYSKPNFHGIPSMVLQ